MTTRSCCSIYQDHRRLLLLVVGLLCWLPLARAETTTLELPSTYADFALNPQTGDVAAIDPEQGTVAVFSAQYLAGDKGNTRPPIKIGSTPVSICFKQFGKDSYFAIVCSTDANIYLIDTGNLSRAVKVPISGTGASLIGCSRNPEDPYLYYNYGSGHESFCGAIDIRDKTDYGKLFDSAMDSAYSASGLYAYRRGPWSPSGFEALQRTSPLSAKKPVFQSVYREHQSSMPYVPDPFDTYTSTGGVLHTFDLTKRVTTLNFSVVAFTSKPPLVIGLSNPERQGNPAQKPTLLYAASYNSFRVVGAPIPLPATFGTVPKPLPRGVPGQADFKAVTTKTRILPDEARSRIICASLNQIAVVPLADFGAPDEPLLHAAFESEATIRVGRASDFKFRQLDARTKMTFEELPDGATVSGHQVEWMPSSEQVGTHKITVLLKHGDLERRQSFSVEVENESMTLPFSPNGMVLSPSGRMALVWSNPTDFNQGQSIEVPMAVVDVERLAVLAKKSESIRIHQPVLSDKFLFLYEPEGSYVQVHELETLKRIKTVYTDGPIQRLFVYQDVLIASGHNRTSCFSLPTLLARKGPSEGMAELHQIGVVWNNTVLDSKLATPQLLLNSPLLTLGQTDPFRQGMQSQQMAFMTGEPRLLLKTSANGITAARYQPTLDASSLQPPYRASVELKPVASANNRPSHSRVTLRLHDWLRNSIVLQVPLAQKRMNNEQSSNFRGPLVAVSGPRVTVAWNDLLIPYSLPTPLPAEFKSGVSVRPDHSHLSLSAAKDGVLKLAHRASGGTAPHVFSLGFSPGGVEINEQTGEVTIVVEDVVARAVDLLSKNLVAPISAPATTELERYQATHAEELTRLLGRKPTSPAAFLPIHLRVQDAEGQLTELRFGLIVEPPLARVTDMLNKRRTEMAALAEKQAANRPAVPEGPVPPERNGTADELKRLREKVETLDARIDLLTRQLAELLKQQPVQKPKE